MREASLRWVPWVDARRVPLTPGRCATKLRLHGTRRRPASGRRRGAARPDTQQAARVFAWMPWRMSISCSRPSLMSSSISRVTSRSSAIAVSCADVARRRDRTARPKLCELPLTSALEVGAGLGAPRRELLEYLVSDLAEALEERIFSRIVHRVHCARATRAKQGTCATVLRRMSTRIEIDRSKRLDHGAANGHNRWHPELPAGRVHRARRGGHVRDPRLARPRDRSRLHARRPARRASARAPADRAAGGARRRAGRRPRDRGARLRDRRLRLDGDLAGLGLSRRPLRAALPRALGDRRRGGPLRRAARRGRARLRSRRRDRRGAIARAVRSAPWPASRHWSSAAATRPSPTRGTPGRRRPPTACAPTRRARTAATSTSATSGPAPGCGCPSTCPGLCCRWATSTSPRATARCASPRSRPAAAPRCASSLRKEPRWRPTFPAYEAPPRPPRAMFATTGIPLSDDGEQGDLDLNLATPAGPAGAARLAGAQSTGSRPRPAYVLMSVAAELRVSELVDAPNALVSAAMPLDVFE